MRTEQARVAGGGWRVTGTGRRPLILALLLVTLGAGCRMMQTAVEVPGQAVRAVTPGKKDKGPVDPVDVQQKLLRFANELSAESIAGVDKLKRGTNAIDPAEALKLKLVMVTESCSIASGPNALANLLDMTVFVTLTRMSIEDHWQPNVYGASAQAMLDVCRGLETNIWKLAGTLLKAEQQEELRQAIAAWRQLHPVPEKVMGARAVGFATEVGQATKTGTTAPDSVFAFLGLDPLAGLDPATREIAQARMFAERTLFVTQWMPTLLRWQIELMSLNTMAMPEVQQLITNSTHLAASVGGFARVAEQLPVQLSAERHEILKALESQEKGLTSLAAEVRQTLGAASQMSTSLNTTIITFDALMKRFGVGEKKNSASDGPPATNSTPFRIQDYGQTAVQMEGMARQLTELIRTLDQTIGSSNLTQLSSQAGPVVASAQSAGKQVVDYAFWKAILLVGIVLAAALLYRLLATRMSPGARGRNASP